MNRKCLLLTLFLLGFIISGYSQDKLFDKFAHKNEVTSISVSKFLLKMIPDFDKQGIYISKVSDKIESAQMLYTSDKSLAKRMKKQTNKYATNKDYEAVFNRTHDTFSPSTFIKKDPDNKQYIDQTILFFDKGNHFFLIRIDGDNLTLEDVKNLLNK
ncbi:DUF4252 domain-containing protein [Apibacter adventoris]|uniref:DUF4252 domain-containing protein n=1 Tax=Apibacter adventoris TaxID=1679466 RepID=A0A2S8AEG0_9FLAO|nr:DUF4252 domain-containing protein [Apibacter adventoris]PQL93498.1 hypothetical protein C4S77_04975 [Apibacter adventoris]